jgi:Ca2+-binding EF-hand superfamily protein
MPADLVSKLKTFFDRMDADGNGEVSKEEAVAFWGKNFAKVNAQSMFNEVDEDGNESISWDEFRAFWQNVIGSGYPADDLVEEVDMMLEGGSWVDFNDGRTT